MQKASITTKVNKLIDASDFEINCRYQIKNMYHNVINNPIYIFLSYLERLPISVYGKVNNINIVHNDLVG